MSELSILKYIESPGLLAKLELEDLKRFVEEYPFFQTAHMLLLKSLKFQNSEDFQNQLQKSSIFISDRDLLFRFLNKEYEIEEIEVKKEILVPQEDKIEIPNNPALLKNKKVKRKINDSFEGMGENISETLASQIEFSVVKDKDKLQYPSEIYFIDEERNGKNNIITIDADPENVKEGIKKKDILLIEEEESSAKEEDKSDESFELLEIENGQVENSENEEKKIDKKQYFDISSYSESEEEHLEDDLISNFIKKNPRIERNESNEENHNLAEESVKDDSNLLSETLIKVYIKQGLFEKAIQSYEKLSLKYPEKNVYFASQIKILEEKINNQ